ncbi:hypothetical protein O181_121526 [Austropuccinia psidii MF-1]|uniref:Uncharacterized protein n=1 Tax=Austropuccinia psidii MF-1 TaxID=1389203 RepID=A0A9Q3Q1J5_9BASI|nr:hypothetical protein [Austropuccinia psidii MF-1]
MPSTRSGDRYNPSSSSQKAYRHNYGRSQLVSEGQRSVNDSQTERLCHSEADNTVLPSNRAYGTTKNLCGHIQSQPEGLQQFISAQRVPDPCRSMEKLHEFLPICKKIPGPYQHLQVTQWMASIYGKEKHYSFNSRIGEKQPSTTQASARNTPVARSSSYNLKKQTQPQNKGKRKALVMSACDSKQSTSMTSNKP